MGKGQHVHPVGAAMEWVARIVAAVLFMVLPGLGGNWVDQQIGTHFVALIGFVLGIASSLVYLLAITRISTATPKSPTTPKSRTTGRFPTTKAPTARAPTTREQSEDWNTGAITPASPREERPGNRQY